MTPARHLRVVSRALLEKVREVSGTTPPMRDLLESSSNIELTPEERETVEAYRTGTLRPPSPTPEPAPRSTRPIAAMAACMLRLAQEQEGGVEPELLARINTAHPCPAEGICPFSGDRCPVHSAATSKRA
jgi:hypothetical protein